MRRSLTLQNILPYLLIGGAVLGFIASYVLTYDKLQVLQDPSYSPGCNINPILSCGSVMKTEQASLVGMPNTIFGLVAFSLLGMFGVFSAMGTEIRRSMWIGAQVMATAGVIFMHYLFFQAVYRIGAICPWCFLVWIATIPIFWYITLFNLRENMIRLPRRYAPAVAFVQRHHGDILALWYLILFGLIAHRFWYFWSTLL